MRSHDTAPVWLPTPSAADRYLGPYRVIRKIGSGGMGIVYLGADPADQPVAIKVLREFIADDMRARSRLAREVETLRRVRHRCIASVIDADLDGDSPYLVTEYIQGPQLDAYIDDVGPLSRAGLANLGSGLIGALNAIHEVGVVHRDLKPGNIMLRKDTPMVIDFGIAQAADDVRLTVTGLFVGTPGYVAPEVIDGTRSTTATDWWGWAATMVFAATGRGPAGTGPVPVVLDRIRSANLDLDGIDHDLEPLLRACLQTAPHQRPNADVIRREFDRYAAGHAPRITVHAPAAPKQRVPTQVMAAPATVAIMPPPTSMPAPTFMPPPTSMPAPTFMPPPTSMPAPTTTTRPPWAALRRAEPPTQHQPTPVAQRQPDSLSRRRGTFAAIAFFILVLGAGWPVIALLTFTALVIAVRFADQVTGNLARRRELRGPRPGDIARETARSPWHLAVSAVRSVAGLLIPVAIGAGVSVGALGILHQFGASFDPGRPGKNLALVAGFAVMIAIAWWGPGGSSLRLASTRAVRAISARRTSALVMVGLFVFSALILLLLVLSFPSVIWWPWQGMSLPFS